MLDSLALCNLIKGLQAVLLKEESCRDKHREGGFEFTKSINDCAFIIWSLNKSLIRSWCSNSSISFGSACYSQKLDRNYSKVSILFSKFMLWTSSFYYMIVFWAFYCTFPLLLLVERGGFFWELFWIPVQFLDLQPVSSFSTTTKSWPNSRIVLRVG